MLKTAVKTLFVLVVLVPLAGCLTTSSEGPVTPKRTPTDETPPPLPPPPPPPEMLESPFPDCMAVGSSEAEALTRLGKKVTSIPTRQEGRGNTWKWTLLDDLPPGGMLVLALGSGVRDHQLLGDEGEEIQDLSPDGCGRYPLPEEGKVTLEARLRSEASGFEDLEIFALPSLQEFDKALGRIVQEQGEYFGRADTRLDALRALVAVMQDVAQEAQALRAAEIEGIDMQELAQVGTLARIVQEALDEAVLDKDQEEISRLLRRLAGDRAVRDQEKLFAEAACLDASLLAERLGERAKQLEEAHGSGSPLRLDDFLADFGAHLTDLRCEFRHERCPAFERYQFTDTLEGIFGLAVSEARQNLCTRPQEGKKLLEKFAQLAQNLDKDCRSQSSAGSNLGSSLRAGIQTIDDFLRWQDKERKLLQRFEGRLESLSEAAEEAIRIADTNILEFRDVQARVSDLTIPEPRPPAVFGCTYETSSLDFEHRRLSDRRDQFLAFLNWFEQFRAELWVQETTLPTCPQLKPSAQALRRWKSRAAEDKVCGALQESLGAFQASPGDSCSPLEELHSCWDLPGCTRVANIIKSRADQCGYETVLADTLDYLREQVAAGNCGACRAMDDKIQSLQSGGSVQQRVARSQEVQDLLGRLQREITDDYRRGVSTLRCTRDNLGGDGQGCCNLSAGELRGLLVDRRATCCREERKEFQQAAQGLQKQLASLEYSQDWPALKKELDTIQQSLGSLFRSRQSALGCTDDRSEAIESAYEARANRLLGDEGILLALLRDIARGRVQVSGSDLDSWLKGLGEDDGQPWRHALRIITDSRRLRATPNGSRPGTAILELYENLKNKEKDLVSRIPQESLRRLAREAINEAKSFMGPYDERLLTVRLDAQGSFREAISLDAYEIGAQGRLLKLVFDQSAVDRNRFPSGLSNLVVEFFTDGFTVSASNDDGSPASARSRRPQGGVAMEGLTPYAFVERLGRDHEGAYYRIDPSGVGATIILRVVPLSL